MVRDLMPHMTDSQCEMLFYCLPIVNDEQLYMSDGVGGSINVTKLYESYKLIRILKGTKDGNMENF